MKREYSVHCELHKCQNVVIICRWCSYRSVRETSTKSVGAGSSRWKLTKKCPGVINWIAVSSTLPGLQYKGREFKIASICVSKVVSCSAVRTWPCVALRRECLPLVPYSCSRGQNSDFGGTYWVKRTMDTWYNQVESFPNQFVNVPIIWQICDDGWHADWYGFCNEYK